MIKRLARYILRGELSSLNGKIESLNENNDILRKDCEGIKDIKLRLRVAEMYIDDDAAIDELLAEKKADDSFNVNARGSIAALQAAKRQSNVITSQQEWFAAGCPSSTAQGMIPGMANMGFGGARRGSGLLGLTDGGRWI